MSLNKNLFVDSQPSEVQADQPHHHPSEGEDNSNSQPLLADIPFSLKQQYNNNNHHHTVIQALDTNSLAGVSQGKLDSHDHNNNNNNAVCTPSSQILHRNSNTLFGQSPPPPPQRNIFASPVSRNNNNNNGRKKKTTTAGTFPQVPARRTVHPKTNHNNNNRIPMVTTNHTLSHISRMEDSNLNHHSNPNPHTNSSNSNSNTVHSNSSLSFPTKYFRAEGTTRTGNNNNNNYMIAPRKRSLELMTRLNDLDLDGSVGCLTPQTMTEGGMAFPQTPLMKDCATPTLSQSLLRTPSNYYQTMKRPQQLMRASQDALELSQVNTEYSTFFARRILTDYREVRELGRGAFGRVSLYEEVSSGSLVAVKYSGPLWSSDLERRYRRERSVLNLVRGLPHVVELTAAWEESCEVGEGRPATAMYLQLEYCPGGSVAGVAAARREQQQPWLEEELLTFLAHMVIALHALHSRQIAHVDFKPDNILLDAQQQYKLSDFGCSVLLDDEGRPRREEWYTNNNNKEMDLQEVGPQWSCASVDEGDCRYLCSDMLNGKTHLTAGDMFSLGVTLYELMSGRPLPKNGDEFLQLRRQIPTAFLQQRGYSDRLIHVVASLMADDPTARPTAQQLLLYLRPSPVQCQLLADRELLTQTAVQYAQADRPKEMERELRYLAAVSEATTYFLQTLLAGDLAPPNTRGAPMRSQAPKNGNREEACTPVNQPDPHGVSW